MAGGGGRPGQGATRTKPVLTPSPAAGPQLCSSPGIRLSRLSTQGALLPAQQTWAADRGSLYIEGWSLKITGEQSPEQVPFQTAVCVDFEGEFALLELFSWCPAQGTIGTEWLLSSKTQSGSTGPWFENSIPTTPCSL